MSSLLIAIAALGWLLALVTFILLYRQKIRWIETEAQKQQLQTTHLDLQQKVVQLEAQDKQWQQKFFEAESRNQNSMQLTQQMRETFQALSLQALEGQTKQFVEYAQQALSKHTELAKADLDKRHTVFDGTLAPLKTAVESLQRQAAEMEKERQRSYQSVETELRRVIESSSQLSQETRSLKNALKKPHIRGRWGEVQLKNCVELAGMSEYADVNFQDINITDGQVLIPDMTVKMPGGRIVIVDAKTPIEAFMSSLEATNDEQRALEMQRHGSQVKEHIKNLSQKSYYENFKSSADFTVMFLPNESFLYAALETQPDLMEFALDKKILIATPPTFVGLLKVIRHGWIEDRQTKNAARISEIGKELHKRIVEFVANFQNVGKSLARATESYEKGLNQLNTRVLVQARRMGELGAKSNKDLPDDLGFELAENETENQEPPQIEAASATESTEFSPESSSADIEV